MNAPIWDPEKWGCLGVGTADPLSRYRVLAWVSGSGNSSMGLSYGDYQRPDWMRVGIGSGFGHQDGNGTSPPER